MKWIYRFLTLVMLGGALVVPFFINNQKGEPMLSLPGPDDLLPGSVGQGNGKRSLMPGTQTVYKWQDEDGVWHYGDTPPTNIANVSTLEVNPNTNLIQGMKVQEPEAETALSVTPANAPADTLKDGLSLERALNILNEAKEVRGMMEARNEHLNAIVGEGKVGESK